MTAAAGGNAFGNGAGNNAATAQPGGFWTALTAFGGSIYDAIFSNGKTIAVGGVGNIAGGANAVVFTNLSLTLEHDCGTSFCSLQAVSSDGLWGGLAFDSQVGLLNLVTNERFLLPGDATVSGVLGGSNPVLFSQVATGPNAWALGGANQNFADWYLAINGTSLGFTPTSVGDARVFAGMVLQNVNGSVHIANYADPSQGGSSGAVPEPSTYLLIAAGLVGLRLLQRKPLQARTAYR